MNAKRKVKRPQTRRLDYLGHLVDQLIERRIILMMSQEELNYMLGVADHLVSKWETGIRTPTAFNLHCWAEALGSRLTIEPFDASVHNYQTFFKRPSNNNKMMAATA